MLETAVICMALTLHHEARGEPPLGQLGVGQVLYNRAGRNPDNVCREAFRPYQFSWTITMIGIKDSVAFEKQMRLAELVFRMDDFTKGATHYHADHIRPAWSRKMTQTMKIGRHIFYRSK